MAINGWRTALGKLVSVIVPSRNEQPYLEKTILNVLENAGGDIEVIVILDGWLPDPQIVIPNGDGKVIWVHNPEAKGQRHAVNQGAKIASGKYVMKLDAHCAVGKDFDTILAKDCEYDMTMIPAMFNLDVLTWKAKDIDDWEQATRRGKLNPYMYIGWKGNHLRSLYYPSKVRKQLYNKRKDKPVDETMTCMGPGFFMHKDRFWELGGMDEGHGQWGQMGVEVACKAWLSGGRLMTNKNTWFAHFFRGGGVPEGHKSGFPYSLSQGAVDRARQYSDDLWLNDKWPQQKRKFMWLVEKFNPPTWESFSMGKLKNRDKLIELFRDLGFKKGAEVGVDRGIFSRFMHKTIPDLELISVDDWKPHTLTPEKRLRRYVRAKRALCNFRKNTIIRGNSIETALGIPDESLDFVYIDADHNFNGVMADIIVWSQKVRKGGIVSGHDYKKVSRKGQAYGVIDAVNIYCKYNKKELLTTASSEKDGSRAPSWYFYK